MPAPRRQALKSEIFDQNISKRGLVSGSKNKKSKYPVGPIILGLFLFLVVGSAIFQIIHSVSKGSLL